MFSPTNQGSIKKIVFACEQIDTGLLAVIRNRWYIREYAIGYARAIASMSQTTIYMHDEEITAGPCCCAFSATGQDVLPWCQLQGLPVQEEIAI